MSRPLGRFSHVVALSLNQVIGELLANPAAVRAMLGMRKLDIAALVSAATE